MSHELFKVYLPDGNNTKPYSKSQIRASYRAGKIPQGAKVKVYGRDVSISEFVEETLTGMSLDVTTPAGGLPVVEPATEQQLRFARSLGIDCPPGITKARISELIGEAKAKQSADELNSGSGTSKEFRRELEERIRSEILAEMRATGDVPLSKATPEDIARHFNDVRFMNMLLIYSENNAFERLIAAADSGELAECEGAMLAFGTPQGMPRQDLRDLLIAVMWSFDMK